MIVRRPHIRLYFFENSNLVYLCRMLYHLKMIILPNLTDCFSSILFGYKNVNLSLQLSQNIHQQVFLENYGIRSDNMMAHIKFSIKTTQKERNA